MKEKLKELAKTCEYPNYFDYEKFAELVVLECIKIIDNEQPGYQDYRSQIEVMMRNDCAKALEYKFGLPINERF
jgi:hypothetical protein